MHNKKQFQERGSGDSVAYSSIVVVILTFALSFSTFKNVNIFVSSFTPMVTQYDSHTKISPFAHTPDHPHVDKRVHGRPCPLKNSAKPTPLDDIGTSSSESNAAKSSNIPKDKYDVCIVGSGIGGLSCAAMLSLYGYKVAVFESHTHPGGCAHGFIAKSKNVDGVFKFDTGPSFFSGLNPNYRAKLSNPLRMVLDAIDEKVECIPYSTFGLKLPQGDFIHSPSFGKDDNVIQSVAGSNGVKQWNNLMKKMEPLANAVDALPTVALRGDVGVALTTSSFLPNFAKGNPLENLKLTKPFSKIIENAGVKNDFVKQWLDLLCFCLSGLPADGTITAEMAMMMGEFYDDDAIMDCPKGGAASIVDALVRGIEKHGGSVFVNSHVEKINIENGRANGITLKKKGQKIEATKAVISNISVWDLFKSNIVDNSLFPEKFVKERLDTPVGKSFMHLHIGFKATREELEKLEAHYMYIDDWSRGVDADDNAVLLSIPSVHDETLAPSGHAVLHIYTPATEDYGRWKNLDRKSEEYKTLKDERSEYLWNVLEKVIPDIRERSTIVQVGTPLTHQRFLRRYKGSYGPAIRAGEGSFPFPGTPVKNLLLCGDSCFPGIGVPAVAGSGILAANSVSLDSLRPQLEVLEKLKNKTAVTNA
jgi:phytoene dehydrogenase-like protein